MACACIEREKRKSRHLRTCDYLSLSLPLATSTAVWHTRLRCARVSSERTPTVIPLARYYRSLRWRYASACARELICSVVARVHPLQNNACFTGAIVALATWFGNFSVPFKVPVYVCMCVCVCGCAVSAIGLDKISRKLHFLFLVIQLMPWVVITQSGSDNHPPTLWWMASRIDLAAGNRKHLFFLSCFFCKLKS